MADDLVRRLAPVARGSVPDSAEGRRRRRVARQTLAKSLGLEGFLAAVTPAGDSAPQGTARATLRREYSRSRETKEDRARRLDANRKRGVARAPHRVLPNADQRRAADTRYKESEKGEAARKRRALKRTRRKRRRVKPNDPIAMNFMQRVARINPDAAPRLFRSGGSKVSRLATLFSIPPLPWNRLIGTSLRSISQHKWSSYVEDKLKSIHGEPPSVQTLELHKKYHHILGSLAHNMRYFREGTNAVIAGQSALNFTKECRNAEYVLKKLEPCEEIPFPDDSTTHDLSKLDEINAERAKQHLRKLEVCELHIVGAFDSPENATKLEPVS